MSEPFIGEIRMWGCNFAPRGWVFCTGGMMPISENTALFAVIGTNFGGDGRTTMGIPNLQGRVPMHWGNGPGIGVTDIGEWGGTETVTLIASEIPPHTHQLTGQAAATTVADPAAAYLGQGTVAVGPRKIPLRTYGEADTLESMDPAAIGEVGQAVGHENRQPYQVVNFCMAIAGLFPSRN